MAQYAAPPTTTEAYKYLKLICKNVIRGIPVAEGNARTKSPKPPSGAALPCGIAMVNHTYLVFYDIRFAKRARLECSEVFGPGLSYDESLSCSGFSAAHSELDPAIVSARFAEKSPVFLYGIASLASVTEAGHDSVMSKLSELADRSVPMRIEVMNIGSHSSENAKSTEVRLGRALEADGFSVDIGHPRIYLYAIFFRGKVLVCAHVAGLANIDSFRHRGTERGKSVSRAEFKLREALGAFGVDMSSVKHAIDIGASPGGWTGSLISMGVKVVAVDSAPLSYPKLGTSDIAVFVSSDNPSYQSFTGPECGRYVAANEVQSSDWGRDLVHVARPANLAIDQVRSVAGVNKFDMMLVDINEEPSKAANAAVDFAGLLKPGGFLILTIKMVDMDVERRIREAKASLGDAFRGIRLRKLPHNRREITLFALKG